MIYKKMFGDSELPEIMSKEEIGSCYEKMILGDKMARQQVIEHNLRLVANQVSKKFYNTGIPLEDLASVGTIGLIKAVDSFDINKGFAFATYAIRCIDNEILMFLRKEKKYFDIDSFENPVCYDENKGKELLLDEVLADPNSDFMINFEKFEDRILIRRAVKKLPEKDRKIIELFYGFNGIDRYNQVEIAAMLNVSKSYVSRLITKINQKVKQKYLREKPLLYVFDVKEIHAKLTNDVFFSLLKIFPENDIRDYKKYRNIILSSKSFLLTKEIEENYSPEFIARISLIEQDMRDMFLYYLQLKEENIDYDTAILKVKEWAFKNLSRFKTGHNLVESKDDILNPPSRKTILSKFPDKTFDELVKYLEKLPLEYKNVLYIRHGETLNKYYDFPKDKTYESYCDLYTKAVSALENLIDGIDIVEKESEEKNLLNVFSKQGLLYAIPKLSLSDQEVVYLKHGHSLLENNPFPAAPVDKHPNYYKLTYYNLLKKIDKILKKHEEIKNSISNNAFAVKLGDYTYDEVIEEIGLLKKEERDIIFIRHGKNLDGLNPFPSKMPFSYYKNLYNNAVRNLREALNKKKNPIEFEKRQRHLEEIRTTRQEVKKISKNETNRAKETIIYCEKREDLLWAMEYLSPVYKKVLILRHGENLDKVIPWPAAPAGKSKNYYYVSYYNMCKSIKKIIQNKETLIKNEAKNLSKSHKYRETILDTIDHDKLLNAVMLLSDKQREIIYLRHGENLDKINPWPKIPEGKCSNYYYLSYCAATKKINEIIQNGNKKQRKNHVSKNEIIFIKSREDLIYAINCLSEKEKNIFYLRHGENLDSVLPWPKVSDGKSENYYYASYSRIIKKINEIIAKKEETKNILIKQKEETFEKNVSSEKEIIKMRESFIETKSQLEQMKLRNFAATLYDKYIALYGSILTEKEIELIVCEAIDSYSYDEGLSLELSALFKIESKILLILSNKYRNDPDSEESLNILLLIEEIFGNRIKAHYTNTSYDTPYYYVSSELVSKAIEQALLDYTGRSPFYTEMALKLKKLY